MRNDDSVASDPTERGFTIRNPVFVSGPWQPLQVFSDAWNRASGLAIPGPFHAKKSLNAEPARKFTPSNVAGTVLLGAPGTIGMIACALAFTKSANVCVPLNETSGVSLTVTWSIWCRTCPG